jgi:hypothetical protein
MTQINSLFYLRHNFFVLGCNLYEKVAKKKFVCPCGGFGRFLWVENE